MLIVLTTKWWNGAKGLVYEKFHTTFEALSYFQKMPSPHTGQKWAENSRRPEKYEKKLLILEISPNSIILGALTSFFMFPEK